MGNLREASWESCESESLWSFTTMMAVAASATIMVSMVTTRTGLLEDRVVCLCMGHTIACPVARIVTFRRGPASCCRVHQAFFEWSRRGLLCPGMSRAQIFAESITVKYVRLSSCVALQIVGLLVCLLGEFAHKASGP